MTDGPTFEVIPAIDLQEGEVVQLVQGERGTERRYGDPVVAARRWVDAGAETLHLVDLDGAFSGAQANATAIDRIRAAVDVPIQLGGGIRTREDATGLFARGIDRVILGTAAIESPEMVEALASEQPGRVIVSLDAKAGEVVVEGWTEGTGLAPEALAGRFEDRGVHAILCTNVDVEGRLDGVEASLIQRVAETVDIPVIASGGVATLEDLATLKRAGAAAAVVGTALYEEAFSLEEAIEAMAS